MKHRILITGGMGTLGGRVAQLFATQDEWEIILGSRKTHQPPAWCPDAQCVLMDWHSLESLHAACEGVESILHLAALNDAECALDPVQALAVNGVNTALLLQEARKRGVRRFTYLSTAHVYGQPLMGVVSEESCPTSLHPYATSHRAGEDVVRMAHQRGEIEGIVIRLSNSFGAPADRSANCWMLLVNDLCRQAVTTNRMVLRSSGAQKRNFIPLVDACRALGHLLKLPTDKLSDGLFNVGGDWSPTILEMTQYIAERIHIITGQEPKILRKQDQNHDNSELFDYKITKLLNTGFSLKANHRDQEIDGLIRFCLEHFT